LPSANPAAAFARAARLASERGWLAPEALEQAAPETGKAEAQVPKIVLTSQEKPGRRCAVVVLPMACEPLEHHFQLLPRAPDPADCDRIGVVEMGGCFQGGIEPLPGGVAVLAVAMTMYYLGVKGSATARGCVSRLSCCCTG